MLIKFLTSLEGPTVHVMHGDVDDWPDAAAQRLIDRGLAIAVPAGTLITAAGPRKAVKSMSAVEKAVRPSPKAVAPAVAAKA